MMKDGDGRELDNKIDEENLKQVTGGGDVWLMDGGEEIVSLGVYSAKTGFHYCRNCGKKTLCIEAGNGYVCKSCGTLN